MKHSGNTGFLRRDGAVIFGLVLSLLAATVGFAIDASRQVTTKRLLQSMTDAAALSGAKEFATSGSQVKTLERIESSLRANVTNRFADARCGSLSWGGEFTEGSIWVRATCVVPTMFGVGISGESHMLVTTTSRAKASSFTLDMALVLDTSNSMVGTKLDSLKIAAEDVIDTLMRPTDSVRIAIVPFGGGVNGGIYGNRALGRSDAIYAATNDQVCMGARNDAKKYTDELPLDDRALFETWEVRNCPARPSVPLSDDTGILKAEIGHFVGGGNTPAHIGLEWGWYFLSPKWASILPPTSRPKDYGNPEELKAIVFMSDGQFNGAPSHQDHEPRQARMLCAGMRAEGIIIFSVAFEAGPVGQQLMRDCAGADDYYYQADDNDELIAAFAHIARRFKGVALVE